MLGILLGLAKRYWKGLLIVSVIVGLGFALNHYGNTRYDAGAAEALAKAKAQIEKANARNRELEKKIQTSTTSWDEERARLEDTRHLIEDTHEKRLIEIVRTAPESQCRVPDEAIRELNAIRAEGGK